MLGSSAEGRKTFVVLSFAGRSFTMAILWEGDVMTGFQLDGGVDPTDVFRPSAEPTHFVAKAAFGRTKDLIFEIDDEKDPRGLDFASMGRRHHAQARGDAP